MFCKKKFGNKIQKVSVCQLDFVQSVYAEYSPVTIHYMFTGKSVYVRTAVESRLRVVMGQVCNTISIFCKCSF